MEGLYQHENQAICFLKPGFLIAHQAAEAVSLWSMWRLRHQGNDAVSLRYWKGEKVALHYCILPSKALEMLWRQKKVLAEACVCIFVPMHSIISEYKKNQEGQIQRIPSLALQATQYRQGQGVRVCEISHSPVIWEVAVMLKDMKNMGGKKKFKWSQHLINQHSIKRKKNEKEGNYQRNHTRNLPVLKKDICL